MQERMFPEHEAPMLKCCRCKEFLPATREYFYVDSQKRGGWNRTCKSCLKKQADKGQVIEIEQGKICSLCKRTLPIQDFYKTPYYSGYTSWCKECTKEKARKHPQAKFKGRKATLKRYGITPEMYDELTQKQNGVCASCGKYEVLSNKNGIVPLSVDHCHVTGKVRGLLCNSCNVALGHLKDDPERIKALLKYLESHNENH
jgi:hypothetical protein